MPSNSVPGVGPENMLFQHAPGDAASEPGAHFVIIIGISMGVMGKEVRWSRVLCQVQL